MSANPAINPNWPVLLGEFQGTASPYYGSGGLTGYTDFTKRLIREWSINRGRQYELNQIEPGKTNLVWNNIDGQLDPASSSSVFAGALLPYRAWRMRMQWPPTPNRLTADQATAGESTPVAPGAIPASMNIGGNVATPVIAACASAYQGSQVYQVTVPPSTASGALLLSIQSLSVRATVPSGDPPVPFTASFFVRSNTLGANPQLAAAITWRTFAGTQVALTQGATVTATGSTTTGWTRIVVSAYPPTGAMSADMEVVLAATGPGVTWTFQADAPQFEVGSAASGWTQSGLWYPVYAGMVERYPPAWDHQGNFGTITPIVVDTLALLSNVLLPDPLTAAIFTPSGGSKPSFAYLLNDPSGSGQFADATGQRGFAQIVPSKYGAGTITSGTALTSATASLLPMGAPGQTVTNFTSSAGAGLQFPTNAMSWLTVPPNTGSVAGPGGGTGLGWTRMIAFRLTATPAYRCNLWSAQDHNAVNAIGMLVTSSLNVYIAIDNATYTGFASLPTSVDVGNWHLAWLGISADGSQFITGIDNSVGTYTPGSGNYTFPGGFAYDIVGATAVSWDSYAASWNFTGDMADFVEWPYLLTTSQISAIYNAWRTAYSGDSSGQRYARILGWAGYTGPTAIDFGNSTSLGPATDVGGIDAFSALEAVTETENGQHFVAKDGTITFYARQRRYAGTSPTAIAATFGENVAGGEWPYEDCKFDFDTAHLANNITITQASTGQQVTAIDQSSQTAYGAQTLTQSNQSTNLQECQDQANYLLSRYKDPHLRINKLTVHPSAMARALPGIWPAMLGLDLGARILVNRRPPSPAVSESLPCFVEQENWTAKDNNDVTLDFQGAPADLTPYALFTTLHASLKNQVTGPTNTLVLNPLPDAATNPASATLYAGQQLTIDYGLGTQETVTVQSVGATSPGYSSVTITLTGNTTQLHAAGANVSEVMPAGSASTSIYDQLAVFGTALFAY